jgi:hypothetical protein
MYRKNPSPLVEVLESRTLLSGTAPVSTPAPHRAETSLTVGRAVSERTTSVLSISKHVSILGQPLKFTITVKAATGAGTPAGTVELIDNGATVAGAGSELVLTLSPKGRAAYTFEAGNLAVYAGVHTFSALYIPGDSHLGSISKAVTILVKAPKFRRAADGLGTATVQNGHGKTIGDGQNATVLYTGFLQSNGEIFDYATSTSHGPDAPTTLTFQVNADPEQVINGFDRGVRGMKVGETRDIAIPAALGYGISGSGSSVPSNADLLFIVKLLSIT